MDDDRDGMLNPSQFKAYIDSFDLHMSTNEFTQLASRNCLIPKGMLWYGIVIRTQTHVSGMIVVFVVNVAAILVSFICAHNTTHRRHFVWPP